MLVHDWCKRSFLQCIGTASLAAHVLVQGSTGICNGFLGFGFVWLSGFGGFLSLSDAFEMLSNSGQLRTVGKQTPKLCD